MPGVTKHIMADGSISWRDGFGQGFFSKRAAELSHTERMAADAVRKAREEVRECSDMEIALMNIKGVAGDIVRGAGFCNSAGLLNTLTSGEVAILGVAAGIFNRLEKTAREIVDTDKASQGRE